MVVRIGKRHFKKVGDVWFRIVYVTSPVTGQKEEKKVKTLNRKEIKQVEKAVEK